MNRQQLLVTLTRAFNLCPTEIGYLTIPQINMYMSDEDLPDLLTFPNEQALLKHLAKANAG